MSLSLEVPLYFDERKEAGDSKGTQPKKGGKIDGADTSSSVSSSFLFSKCAHNLHHELFLERIAIFRKARICEK
jgi:hypothetical protein